MHRFNAFAAEQSDKISAGFLRLDFYSQRRSNQALQPTAARRFDFLRRREGARHCIGCRTVISGG
jgi:hypothetical protein